MTSVFLMATTKIFRVFFQPQIDFRIQTMIMNKHFDVSSKSSIFSHQKTEKFIELLNTNTNLKKNSDLS